MKRICYITTTSYAIRAFFIEQLKYLSNNGFDVSVICSKDFKLYEDLGENVRYIPLDMPRGVNILNSIKSVISLIRLLKIEQFDFIQYSTINAAIYASIASFITGTKIRVYHMMGLRFVGLHGIAKFITKFFERLVCIFSTHIDCVSKSCMEVAITNKIFNPKKGYIVWNGSSSGVNLLKFDITKKLLWRKEIRGKFKILDCDIVYGFVGRITKDKGIDELLQAFKYLNIQNTKLLIVGDFESQQNLNQDLLTWAFSNKNIIFHKSVTDIEKYYASFDVLVLPSYREGLPTVIIEAQAMGVPVIISDIPAANDSMIKNKTGLVVRTKDPINLSQGMAAMSNNEKRLANGKSGFHFVKENFDSIILCNKILECKELLLKY